MTSYKLATIIINSKIRSKNISRLTASFEPTNSTISVTIIKKKTAAVEVHREPTGLNNERKTTVDLIAKCYKTHNRALPHAWEFLINCEGMWF